MRLPFRQGVVQRPSSCLQKIANDIAISTANGPIVLTLSYHSAEYYHTEPQNINQYTAWTNLTPATDYWLYIDINKLTGMRTFGQTLVAPISGTIPVNNPTVDQHWFDTNSNTTKVWTGSVWVEYIRVFIAKITGTDTFVYNNLGTQVGTAVSYDSGRILFDGFGKVITQSNGMFMTTEDQFFVDGANIKTSKLEPAVITAFAAENIPDYSIVTYKSFDRIGLASYEDIGNAIIAIVTDGKLYGDVTNLVLQGIVTNPNWNWSNVNTPLWVDTNGVLTDIDPHVTNSLRPKAVPIARVISPNTIFIEQGLGGPGAPGINGNVATVGVATTTAFGIVKMVTVPADVNNPLVVGDNDPRLTDARTPKPHTHPATDVTYIGHTGLPSDNLQNTIDLLDTNKLNLSGGTMTGLLTLSGNPTTTLQAATKQYVDSRVMGLIWIDPISYVNLVSDNLNSPPNNPSYTDIYVVASGGNGVWAGKDGHMMRWDGSTVGWTDLGVPTAGMRIGVAIESSTVPTGSFLNQKNNVAIWNSPSWTFYVPVNNNAVYVNNVLSLHSFHQYAFNAAAVKWIEFGGQMSIVPGANLSLSANILNVVGGSGSHLDADTIDGLDSTAFALVNHTHSEYLKIAGGIMTGMLTLFADPVDALDAVTKQYVDNLLGDIAQPIGQVVYGSGTSVTSAPEFSVDVSTGMFNFIPLATVTPSAIQIQAASADINDPTNNYNGGSIHLVSGDASGGSFGGEINILAGAGGPDASSNDGFGSNGGLVLIQAGTGGITGGNGGKLTLSAGSASVLAPVGATMVQVTPTGVPANGGDVTIESGFGFNGGFGGSIYVDAKEGGNHGDGGNVNVTAGAGGAAGGMGGSIALYAGPSQAGNYAAGDITIQAGEGIDQLGNPGSVFINAGTNSGAGFNSDSGYISFRTGVDPGIYGIWERLRITALGEWSLSGNVGQAGELLTSQGADNPPIWSPVDLSGVVSKSGDTMSGLLQLYGDPQSPLQAATKQYVDNHVYTIPYDISFFVAGNMIYGSSDVGSFLSPRTIVIDPITNPPLGVCKVAPVTSVTYTIKLNNVSVGTVSFNAGVSTMTYNIPAPFTMHRGDVLDLYTPSVIESNIKDVTIILTGSSLTG
jgi:hypothetical protein